PDNSRPSMTVPQAHNRPDQPNAWLSRYIQYVPGSSMNGMTATVAESPDFMRAYRKAKTATVTRAAAPASGSAARRSALRATRSAGRGSRAGGAVAPSSPGVISGSIAGLPGRGTPTGGVRV